VAPDENSMTNRHRNSKSPCRSDPVLRLCHSAHRQVRFQIGSRERERDYGLARMQPYKSFARVHHIFNDSIENVGGYSLVSEFKFLNGNLVIIGIKTRTYDLDRHRTVNLPGHYRLPQFIEQFDGYRTTCDGA